MNHKLSAALVCLLFSHHAEAHNVLNSKVREAFRQAVDDYQIFVVPHCAPEEVHAYVAARADRDRAFVRSLRKTELMADYEHAVADRAARDQHTVYECAGPPPPPPPGTAPSPPALTRTEPQQHESVAEDFDAGDRQFDKIVRLRDALIGSPSL